MSLHQGRAQRRRRGVDEVSRLWRFLYSQARYPPPPIPSDLMKLFTCQTRRSMLVGRGPTKGSNSRQRCIYSSRFTWERRQIPQGVSNVLFKCMQQKGRSLQDLVNVTHSAAGGGLTVWVNKAAKCAIVAYSGMLLCLIHFWAKPKHRVLPNTLYLVVFAILLIQVHLVNWSGWRTKHELVT